MKKIMPIIIVLMLVFCFAGCEDVTIKEYSKGSMSITVPVEWKVNYNEAINEILLEDTGEEGTGTVIKFQLLGENIEPEKAATNFEGTMDTIPYEEIEARNIGGIDLRGVTFSYSGHDYIMYGGNSFEGKQVYVTILDIKENTAEGELPIEEEVYNIIDTLKFV